MGVIPRTDPTRATIRSATFSSRVAYSETVLLKPTKILIIRLGPNTADVRLCKVRLGLYLMT